MVYENPLKTVGGWFANVLPEKQKKSAEEAAEWSQHGFSSTTFFCNYPKTRL